MIRKILVCCAFVLAVQAFAPAEAAACGGPGEVPCYVWDWCAYRTYGLVGDSYCWGGLVYATSYNGCSSDRVNNWGLVCVSCGASGQPTCDFGTTCNTDQRYTPFGLCYPCGRGGQPACVSGASCDQGYRPIFGFCSYSGFSNEPTTNVVTMPTLTQSASGPVRGIADLHTHQFSNLGFGGVVFWGAPYDARGINYALPWCDYTWEFSTKWASSGITGPIAPTLGYEIHGPKALQALTDPITLGVPEGQHDVSGTGPFDGWPTHNTSTHQQMYYKWLERAYLGGIRLIVQHMVSNEALCSAGKIRGDFTCNDMDAVNKQIQATKDLERAVDLMDDGQANNSGWYRIAYSPSQARQIIRGGKLAVVLGLEVDSLFNCKPGTTCTRDSLRTQLQSYFSKGIRHIFPIHQFDNAFGGAALFKDELNAGNIVVGGAHFKVYDCSSQGYTYNVKQTDTDLLNWIVNGHALPDQKYYDGFAADCNERGLTDTGRALIEEMMDLKLIIDTDHMSRRMVDEVMQMAKTTTDDRPNKYPLVSSHSNFQTREATKDEFSITDAQLGIFKEIGGIVTAPNPKGDCNTSASYKDGYVWAVGKMQKDADDKFPGVAFSTDVNGFAGNTGPRFGNSNCPGTAGTELQYPFAGIMGGTFGKQVTGDRTFDYNTTGEAHYGLLADFFADLKKTGMTDTELDPLLNSAETYIRLWERVNSSDQLAPPTITPRVTGTQGANGWFISDVTVEWDVDPAENAGTPTKVGCGTTTITADTAGTQVMCRATNPTGETSESSLYIRRDTVPPTFTATRLTAARATGWTNQDVEVRFDASDAMSGVGWNPTATVTLTREGLNQTAAYRFYDQAGNSVLATLTGISIDKTRPHIGFRFSSVPADATPAQIVAEQAKWHNAAVTLLVDAQDDLSGIESVTPSQFPLVTEGTTQRATATATDLAGNSVTDESDPIKIDLTPPSIHLLNRLPGANGAGWNKTAVEVNWECGDALSGVPAVIVTRRVESEGDAQSAIGTCLDNAGNTASNTVANIRIDLTPPTLTFGAQQPAANANGWNRTNVQLPFVAGDALSGLAGTSIPSPLLLTSEGAAVNGVVNVADIAGNTAPFTSPFVKIDKTAPGISFLSRLPAANENGWNNSDITIKWNCSDGLSGVAASPVSQTLSMEGANRSLTGTCVDLADNATSDTRGGLSLDKTPPIVQCAADPAALWPPNQKMLPVNVALTFTDALSGTWSYAMTRLASNEAGGADDIAGFAIGSTSLGGSLRAQRDGNGSGRFYTLGYEGRDRAGNTAACSTMVTVPHSMSQKQ